jgi:DnaJ-class molecular chaperone
MASESGDKDGDRAQGSHGPRECMACRGTGRVISNLGGTQSKLPCPWCRGGGVRLTGIDAQAAQLGGESLAGKS